VLLDCSFDLADAGRGEHNFAAGHLPGAIYAHLERDLCGPKHPAGPRSAEFTGRHPLPAPDVFAATAGRWGIGPQHQVVCYDDDVGQYAARAWWLLRWIGHAQVSVLDGGKAAWLAAGGTLSTQASPPQPAAPYPFGAPAMPTVNASTLHGPRVLDARTAERYRGEVEPLDPVAGHIPGARNRFFKLNMQGDGRFKPAATLRAEFEAAGIEATTVHQCGSGVTACHNLLAMEVAGLHGSALYPGSWSEWCADPARPVASSSKG
jgi:thiosulfate/3-mercaptopyruvate sulfurtransferase